MLTYTFFLLVGMVVLIVGADLLIRGATSLARALNISTLVIGLTVVAFGTSAPELFVSLMAALRGSADVAVGNVVGSNIFNVLVVIGLAAVISPVSISDAVRIREMPIMLSALALFWIFGANGTIGRGEGVVLVCLIILYLYLNYRWSKAGKELATIAAVDDAAAGDKPPSSRPPTRYLADGAFVILGLAGMVFGADMVIENATAIARVFGVSELVIGISLVAVGTSLPEVATTVVASWKQEPELVIGNAIGSNLFNVLCVIGVTSLVTPLVVNVQDLPAMTILCALVWPVMLWQKKVGRAVGILMIVLYVSYMAYLFATDAVPV